MKENYFLILLLLTMPAILNSQEDCKCYCSDLCGPRNKRSGIDDPKYDPEHKMCFCLPRDKENFNTKTHQEYDGITCKQKEENNPTILNPNCCEILKD